MKKLAVALIVLALALAGVTALASEEYGEPILFRGIEWGTSMEAMDRESLLAPQSPDMTPIDAHGLAYYLCREADARDYSEYNLYRRSVYASDVGGRALESGYAKAVFVCVPDEDGQIRTSNHATLLLIGGEYWLKE